MNNYLPIALPHCKFSIATELFSIPDNTHQKSWGTLYIFNLDQAFTTPPPPKQCWLLREVHAVTEKFFMYNNAKCLRNRPTLF